MTSETTMKCNSSGGNNSMFIKTQFWSFWCFSSTVLQLASHLHWPCLCTCHIMTLPFHSVSNPSFRCLCCFPLTMIIQDNPYIRQQLTRVCHWKPYGLSSTETKWKALRLACIFSQTMVDTMRLHIFLWLKICACVISPFCSMQLTSIYKQRQCAMYTIAQARPQYSCSYSDWN